jgi:hypothetical protein
MSAISRQQLRRVNTNMFCRYIQYISRRATFSSSAVVLVVFITLSKHYSLWNGLLLKFMSPVVSIFHCYLCIEAAGSASLPACMAPIFHTGSEWSSLYLATPLYLSKKCRRLCYCEWSHHWWWYANLAYATHFLLFVEIFNSCKDDCNAVLERPSWVALLGSELQNYDVNTFISILYTNFLSNFEVSDLTWISPACYWHNHLHLRTSALLQLSFHKAIFTLLNFFCYED